MNAENEPMYLLTRDEKEICKGSYIVCMKYIHDNHCYSLDHAIRFEGYKINPIEPKEEKEKGPICIKEAFVNESQNILIHETDIYETFTDSKKELFLSLQKEYGRCLGFVYCDIQGSPPKKVGWIFEKKMKYTDCDETYIQNVWVSLYEALTETTTRNFPMYL
jgi:hypothetical protein